MKSKLLKTDDGPIHIHRRFIIEARLRAQQEAWMWRFHTSTPRDGWQQHAACRGMKVDVFYGQPGSSAKPAQAVLDMCIECPVRLDCGATLVREEVNNDPNTIHGIRAGFAAKTRENLYPRMTALGFR